MSSFLTIAANDSVAVAVRAIPQGETLPGGGFAHQDIPAGHKVALADIMPDQRVLKYGSPIGVATAPIARGDWVHGHNLRTALEGTAEYHWTPDIRPIPSAGPEPSFMGYERPDGQAGIRNELWVVPGVGCVSHTAELVAREARKRFAEDFTGISAFAHPFGCSQSGCDAATTRRLIAALAKNPNAACVLILGLGCEVNRLGELMPLLEDAPNVIGFETQQVEDEIAHAMSLIEPFAREAKKQTRVIMPFSRLKIGLKCGGSDGYSGLTANPLLGALSDRAVAWGGSCAMTEVPEMFGAEHLLMNRAANREVFERIATMINDYKEYFIRHGEPVYDNPSPGNKDGGITTLEEKSLGCTQKGGFAPVADVVGYAERLTEPGLSLVEGPGNDMVACTALAAAGCQIVLFTTGRGTPYGGPVPTVKLATNSELARRKPGWIDFDAGILLEGTSMRAACDALVDAVVRYASGMPTRAEERGYREMAIFKDGVVQ